MTFPSSYSYPRWAFAPARRCKGRITVSNKTLIDFANWDILGLNENPGVIRYVQSEVATSGVGSCSSRAWGGTTDVHQNCEARLAQFLLAETSLLFSSRPQALTSALGVMLGGSGVIFCEKSSFPLISDIASLLGVECREFVSDRLDLLASALGTIRSHGYLSLVVFIESLADDRLSLPDLAALHQLCSFHRAELCVDESSSLGILGVRGAGGLDDAQIIKSAPTIIASLGRGFGGYGAVVAGSSILIERIVQSSHTTSVEVATPPILSLFALAVSEVVEGAVTARSICRELARELYTTAMIEGYEVHGDPRVPMVDLVFSSREELIECHKFLFDRGIYVSQLPGRLRFIVNVGVGEQDLVLVRESLAAFRVIRDRTFS